MPAEVVIVGAGLAGLACARRLAQCEIPFRLLEASDGVGGRVRTDRMAGFQLDRGFQIYLTAYPEGKRVLDLDALKLRPFVKGALIQLGGKLYPMIDPRRSPRRALRSLLNPIGSFRDKWHTLTMLGWLDHGDSDADFRHENRLTLDLLRWNGRLSEMMINRFYRPFFGGVFLERQLTTSSRFFRFLFRMFATGEAVVPEAGMQAIPEQLASKLPLGSIEFNRPAVAAMPGRLKMADGEEILARAIVVATDGRSAAALTDGKIVTPKFHGCTTLYYSSSSPLTAEPILVLDGDGVGPINHLVEISAAASSYAPVGMSLISATMVGLTDESDVQLDQRVRKQLNGWFPGKLNGWQLLRIDRIADALPDMSAPTFDETQRPVRLDPGLYVCGDHRDQSSIDGTLTSGFRAAQALMEDLHLNLI